MSLVRDTVANFIGGISQQPEKLMYPNQSKKLVNYLLSPSVGLKDRPPTEHIAKLMEASDKHVLSHTIIKENEAYEVLLTGETVKVFDLEGNEKTVEFDEGVLDYVGTTQPLQDLIATTIADYTFILNKKVVTKLSDETFTNSFPHSALIFVKQGNYTADYNININGEQKATYTATEEVKSTKSNVICQDLYNDLVNNLGTDDWNITRLGSVICIKNLKGKSFTIQTEDSNANRDLFAFYETADDLSLLPTVAPNGYIIKIIGENINIADDYYVKFETSDGSAFGSGSWQECCSPDIKYQIDATTMPVALIRQADGSFKLQRIEWTARQAGDEESAPTPSFIGNTIQDIFTHKGRLALVSVDKTIFSDTQDIFSYFKKTTLTELDTDPIDVGSNSKMVLLKHALPFNEALLLFSETSEFSLRGGDVFSNNTVACDLTMEYPCSKFCKPINAGATAFFVFENGNYSRVMEVYITSTYAIDARDITEQAPSYLPKNIYKIAGSTANNMACFLSTEEPDKMYIYNYYYSSEAKAQSAWSEWKFENTKILNADFKENWLYLVMQYPDGIYLERINFSPKIKEKGLNYLFHLDRKVYCDNLTPSEGTTEIKLPYLPVNKLTVVDYKGFPLDYTIQDDVMTVDGEYTNLVVGNTFESKWEMPTIYVRNQTSNGGMKVKEGILMLRDINLCYTDTGYFRVIVSPKYETNLASTFEFTGKIMGMKSATFGLIEVSDGTFLLPVIAKNDEVTIEVINDSYIPSCFLSLEWLGDFNIRGQ